MENPQTTPQTDPGLALLKIALSNSVPDLYIDFVFLKKNIIIALKWFASYLKNRTQSVKVSGFQSEKGFLQFGVPQGFVLGPVLFTM